MIKYSQLIIVDGEDEKTYTIEHVRIENGSTVIIELLDWEHDIFMSLYGLMSLLVGGTAVQGRYELRMNTEFKEHVI